MHSCLAQMPVSILEWNPSRGTWTQDMATMPTSRQLRSLWLQSSCTLTSRVKMSGVKWTQGMPEFWHLPHHFRSSPVINHTDLVDITVQDMGVPKKRKYQAWTRWKSGGQSTKAPLWLKKGLTITGASTMSMRVDMMGYITIIKLRPRMTNGLRRNAEDARQRLQVQLQRHPRQQWGLI